MHSVKRMADLDRLNIEDIIRLPFFQTLERDGPDPGFNRQATPYWKITFKCNKLSPDGKWMLLDEVFESDQVVKWKLIEF